MGFSATFVQQGEIIDYKATADVNAGDIVVQGSLVGVAKTPIGSGCLGGLAVHGVFDVPCSSGTTFSAGAPVYWNATSSIATPTSSASFAKLGLATAAVASGGTLVRVALNM